MGLCASHATFLPRPWRKPQVDTPSNKPYMPLLPPLFEAPIPLLLPPSSQLALFFPHAFWDTEEDLLAHVSRDTTQAGLAFLFYAFPERLAGRGAVLGALFSGMAHDVSRSYDIRV